MGKCSYAVEHCTLRMQCAEGTKNICSLTDEQYAAHQENICKIDDLTDDMAEAKEKYGDACDPELGDCVCEECKGWQYEEDEEDEEENWEVVGVGRCCPL